MYQAYHHELKQVEDSLWKTLHRSADAILTLFLFSTRILVVTDTKRSVHETSHGQTNVICLHLCKPGEICPQSTNSCCMLQDLLIGFLLSWVTFKEFSSWNKSLFNSSELQQASGISSPVSPVAAAANSCGQIFSWKPIDYYNTTPPLLFPLQGKSSFLWQQLICCSLQQSHSSVIECQLHLRCEVIAFIVMLWERSAVEMLVVSHGFYLEGVKCCYKSHLHPWILCGCLFARDKFRRKAWSYIKIIFICFDSHVLKIAVKNK